MTIQRQYESIGGSYEQAARVMKLDNLIDRYVCRFKESKLRFDQRNRRQRQPSAILFDNNRIPL